MASADPAGMHDWHADGYVQEWIDAQHDEERALQLQRLVDLIPFDPDSDIRVLDIGGGYGALTKVVLATFPHSRVVLHDYSEPMLGEARRRFESVSDSVSYYRGDLMSPDWTSGLEGQFEAIVSSIAIHNVRYPDRIRGIYAEVFPLVQPGGCFLNLDHGFAMNALSGGADRHAQLMSRRRRAQADSGQLKSLAEIETELRNERRGRGSRAEVAGEQPPTLATQLSWLLDAGFDEAECFWRDRGNAIIGAFRRPG